MPFGFFESLSKSAATSWMHISEGALLFFGVVLVVGLVGEYRENWKKFEKWFAMLVIVGVAGELLADGAIFSLTTRLEITSNQEIAELTKEAAVLRSETAAANERASHADERAALAIQKAAEEQLARAHLQAAIAPRSLTPKQQKEITEACRPYAKANVHVVIETAFTNDLGFQIFRALKDAGFDVQLQWTTRSLHEVSTGGPPEQWEALTAIGEALVKYVPIIGVTGVLPPGSPIMITVGEKTLKNLPK